MPFILGIIAFFVFVMGLMMCVSRPTFRNEYRPGMTALVVGYGLFLWLIVATEKYLKTEPHVYGPYPVQEVRNPDNTVTHVVVFEGFIININKRIGESLKKTDQVILKRIDGAWYCGLYYFQGNEYWEVFELPNNSKNIEYIEGENYAVHDSVGSARR